MEKVIMVRLKTEKCETIYGEKCGFDLGKEWCDNCATVYEGESQEIMDELVRCGYDIEDIHESTYVMDNYNSFREWWVLVSGRKTKRPELEIIKCQ